MGRYYSGDIEGKFWFGVQPSDDADFFGGQQSEPAEILYSFSEDDLPSIREGIAQCMAALGDRTAKLDAFFAPDGKGSQGYNDQTVAEALQLPETAVREVLAWYARLELGRKILACVEEKGACCFEAEL
jgi:hypothetical protein